MRAAVLQISSGLDYQVNLEKITKLLDSVPAGSFDAIFLPECFYSLSNGKERTPYLVEFQNEHFENIRKLSVKYNAYLIGGSVSYLQDDKIYNRVLNFDPKGRLLETYDKVNLFACDIKKDGERKKVDESLIFEAGHSPLIINVLGFKIGLAVCFDLRFPNFLLNYYRENCDLITFASAFTVPTGKAHWHTLVRARAIEGQCFVIASAQVGQNHPNVATFGHSLVVSPWGEVIDDLGPTEEKIVIHELDKSQLTETRQRIVRTL